MNSNILSLIAFLGVASAAPQGHLQARTTIAVGDGFGLTAIRSGTDVHLSTFQAANGSFFAGMTTQGASCDAGATNANTATFWLGDDGSLHLYSSDAPFQQAYVDASGMGQGIFGYTTGAQPAPANGQEDSFALDASDNLSFNGNSFIACPYNEGYTIWANAGVDNPAGNENCTSIAVLATKVDTPISCTYTSSS